MKILTAIVTVVALLGFGTSAFACDGMKRSGQTTAQSDDAPVWPPASRG
jgi:hypothetical protein